MIGRKLAEIVGVLLGDQALQRAGLLAKIRCAGGNTALGKEFLESDGACTFHHREDVLDAIVGLRWVLLIEVALHQHVGGITGESGALRNIMAGDAALGVAPLAQVKIGNVVLATGDLRHEEYQGRD
jgi:hypothetical protein